MYSFPEDLSATVFEHPMRAAYVLVLRGGRGWVEMEFSRLEVLASRSDGALILRKSEEALGLGWDADGREVPT